MVKFGFATAHEVLQAEQTARDKVLRAKEQALSAPFPDDSLVMKDVFS
jgi:TPP-dependent pyruvate/acetoin dehydrogenase alpha subunit